MSLFGKIVRTTVNIVKLPVVLPIAVAKDALDLLDPYAQADNTREVLRELKEEAEDD